MTAAKWMGRRRGCQKDEPAPRQMSFMLVPIKFSLRAQAIGRHRRRRGVAGGRGDGGPARTGDRGHSTGAGNFGDGISLGAALVEASKGIFPKNKTQPRRPAPTTEKAWHQLSADEIARLLRVNISIGLPVAGVGSRQKASGLNRLTARPGANFSNRSTNRSITSCSWPRS